MNGASDRIAPVSIEVGITRRYLVRFHPKRIPHAFADLLIVGGGIAGLRAALETPPDMEAIVVTKDSLNLSNSAYAQGGIASVIDPQDDFANHSADTIAAGKGLCDLEIVDRVVREAPDRIQELIEYGAKFDRENGEIALTQEGGHSHRRIVHALGDATGKEVMRALIERVRSMPNVQIWEETFTTDLLTQGGGCRGALVWNPRHGKTFIWAKQTILATGGSGRVFRETTNPRIATGDGHAMAFRAGAIVRDMEFMQFHPTVLYIAGSSRQLISEAVRGEGGYLRDISGNRFMAEYHPMLELAPRDDVSRAITLQMEKTQHPCVYLDVTHLSSDLIRNRFPTISRMCAEFGLDITRDQIPVRPGAHYMIGGLLVDDQGRTSLPGLWAAGEVTSSGLHGANRLASNSLLEGLVFGRACGLGATQQAASLPDRYSAFEVDPDPPLEEPKGLSDLNLLDLINSLGSEMGRHAAIRRNRSGLLEAQRQLEFWHRYVSPREFSTPQGWELQNLHLVARLILAGALTREESRGVHFRTDHPEPRSEWVKHVEIKRRRE